MKGIIMTKLSGAILIVAALFLLSSQADAQFKYIGAKGCIMCHKGPAKGSMDEIWAKSKHAGAYNTLTTPKAQEIATAKGIANAAEAQECLECHTIGTKIDPANFDAKFDLKQGVQCESCHGAGSAYKPASIMKNKAEAIKNGMNAYADGIEKQCLTCHNDKSPTFKEFKFTEMWEQIKHKKP